MVLGQPVARLDRDLQACPHAHRIPVLKPRVNPRTDKDRAHQALENKGRDSLPSCSI